jgi:hypothetical protein
VVFSLIIFFSWVVCILSMQLLGPTLIKVMPSWLLSLLVLVVALMLATFAAQVTSRPMGRLFVTHQAPGRGTLIGKVCVVTTGWVNEKFGQAEVDDGGAGMLIQVRCDKADALKRGDQALIIDFDNEREAFLVEPYADMT